MAAATSDTTVTEDTLAGQSAVFKDGDGEPIVGFCLWCGNDFYSIDEMNAHSAYGMLACIGFQEITKDVGSSDLQSIRDVLPVAIVDNQRTGRSAPKTRLAVGSLLPQLSL